MTVKELKLKLNSFDENAEIALKRPWFSDEFFPISDIEETTFNFLKKTVVISGDIQDYILTRKKVVIFINKYKSFRLPMGHSFYMHCKKEKDSAWCCFYKNKNNTTAQKKFEEALQNYLGVKSVYEQDIATYKKLRQKLKGAVE